MCHSRKLKNNNFKKLLWSWGENQYVLFYFIDIKENYKYCTVRCAVEHYTVIINYYQLLLKCNIYKQSQNQKIMGNSQCLRDDVTSILFYWAVKALAIISKYSITTDFYIY